MTSYLITGGGRGLGLEFARQLSRLSSSSKVFVTSRSPEPSKDLQEAISAAESGMLVHITCDVTDGGSISKAADTVDKELAGAGLDVLINNVGAVDAAWRAEGISTMDPDDLANTFNTNVISTHLTTVGFLPLLKKGNCKKVINISTTLGSFHMVNGFLFSKLPAYKITKAALNMLTVQWALDYDKEGFTFVALTPGWVKTDLGSQGADLEPEVAIKACIDTINNKTGPETNGQFLNVLVPGWEETPTRYDGKVVPW